MRCEVEDQVKVRSSGPLYEGGVDGVCIRKVTAAIPDREIGVNGTKMHGL